MKVTFSQEFPIRIREPIPGSSLLEIVRAVTKTVPQFRVKEGWRTTIDEDLAFPKGERPFGIEIRTYPEPSGLQKLRCRVFGEEGYDFDHIHHAFRFAIVPTEQYKQLTCIYTEDLYRTHRAVFDSLVHDLEQLLYFSPRTEAP